MMNRDWSQGGCVPTMAHNGVTYIPESYYKYCGQQRSRQIESLAAQNNRLAEACRNLKADISQLNELKTYEAPHSQAQAENQALTQQLIQLRAENAALQAVANLARENLSRETELEAQQQVRLNQQAEQLRDLTQVIDQNEQALQIELRKKREQTASLDRLAAEIAALREQILRLGEKQPRQMHQLNARHQNGLQVMSQMRMLLSDRSKLPQSSYETDDDTR